MYPQQTQGYTTPQIFNSIMNMMILLVVVVMMMKVADSALEESPKKTLPLGERLLPRTARDRLGSKNKAFFVLETQKNEMGEYLLLIAVEGEKGYLITSTALGTNYNDAERRAQEINDSLGINETEAFRIITSTMKEAETAGLTESIRSSEGGGHIISPKFDLGQLVFTRGVNDKIISDKSFNDFVWASLNRHAQADWGDMPPEDKRENERCLKSGECRLFSAYDRYPLPKIWIITEWDRSVTTVLFPSEY